MFAKYREMFSKSASLLVRVCYWAQRYEFVCIYYYVLPQFLFKLQYFNYFIIFYWTMKVALFSKKRWIGN